MRKHPLAKCEECPLATTGIAVPSDGPEKADVAFVGEAPGVQEARLGRPFMGPSGDLLNTVLRHHDMMRKDLLLTNACLCRPPDNATPPAAAIQACKPRLVAELQQRGTRTAVALGNSAVQALTGRSGVTKLRLGPGIPSSHDPDLRVIPTLHPAFCLRSPDGFPSLIRDIGKVKSRAATFVPPDYEVVRSPLRAIRLCRELLRGEGPLVVDIESHVEKDGGFEHPNQYDMLCIGIGRRREGFYVLSSDCLNGRSYRALGVLLRRRGAIAQNGKFDLAGLYSHIGPIPLKFDTMLASYACDERAGIHGLKGQAQEHLGAPPYDDEVKKYVSKGEGYGNIPRDILYKYNAYDLCCTDDLYEMYRKVFSNKPDLGRLHDFLVAASEQLMFVELNGIAVDIPLLKEMTVSYLDKLRDIEAELDSIVEKGTKGSIKAINPRSPQQVKKALAAMNMKVSGTDVDQLNKILDFVRQLAKQRSTEPERFQIYNFVTTLLKHRREAKLYGTYVKGLRKRLYGGRVFPTFLVHGTTTGRLSCRNPNLQNVPRESTIRDLFIPAKSSRVFVQADYSQAELRVLSWLAGDQYFRKIFNDGTVDLFDDLTPILYPELPPKAYVDPKQWKETRIRVKAFVYGLGYGRGAASIAEEYKIPLHEAEKNKRNFFSVIPEIVAYQNSVRQQLHRGEDLTTWFGRHRRFPLITPKNWHEIEKEGLAFRPQSTSSDICLSALIEVRKDLKGVGWVRNIVHDSILAECDRSEADEVAALLNRRMLESAERVVDGYVKFATDIKIGTTWGQV